MKVVKIDVAKFLEGMQASKYGTGSVANAARLPNDVVQRLIARGEGAEEDINALALALNSRLFIEGESERVPTIEEVMQDIMSGVDLNGQVERARVAYKTELERDKPRKTLLNKIKEEFGADLEIEEAPVKKPKKE
jgi:hypothetical protein